MELFNLPSALVLLASHGLDVNGLWRVVERAFAWTVVRRLVYQLPLGVAVLGLVVMFGWKYYRQTKRGALRRIGKK